MINLTILENGNLRVSIDAEYENAAKGLADIVSKNSADAAWAQIFEEAGLIGNGWGVCGGDDLGCLTEAPFILLNPLPPELPSCEPIAMLDWTYEQAWWFPDYQIINELDILLEKGYVDFTIAKME